MDLFTRVGYFCVGTSTDGKRIMVASDTKESIQRLFQTEVMQFQLSQCGGITECAIGVLPVRANFMVCIPRGMWERVAAKLIADIDYDYMDPTTFKDMEKAEAQGYTKLVRDMRDIRSFRSAVNLKE